MLQEVGVLNEQGSLLTLSLENPQNGLVVEEIDGLDPVRATLVSSEYAEIDGRNYQASRRDVRNIRLRISLDPDYEQEQSVGLLRRSLYPYFMPGYEVKFTFTITDMVLLEIRGRVESMETILFAKNPTVDISVVCFDPDFIDPTGGLIEGYTTSEFDEVLHVYPGTIKTGFMFELLVNRTFAEQRLEIYNRTPQEIAPGEKIVEVMEFPSISLSNFNRLEINTSPGRKSVFKNVSVGAGVSGSMLYELTPPPVSSWIQLYPGENYIRVYADGAPIPFRIMYLAKYGGL